MDFKKSTDFLKQLRENSLKTPNAFSIEMGKRVRVAREEMGLSQSDFAKKLNRRRATISHIETGKSDISISTLVLLAIELNRPISYFFPEFLLKETLLDISDYEHEIINLFRELARFGETTLAIELVERMRDHYKEEFEEYR